MSNKNNKKSEAPKAEIRVGVISKKDLPKQVRELIEGFNVNATNDSGELVFDKETGIPLSEMNDPIAQKIAERAEKILSEPLEPSVELDCENQESKKEIDISITINYGENAPRIKTQLKSKGFKFSKNIIKVYESVRIDLLSLEDFGVLTEKQLLKAFRKLNDRISEHVIKTTFGKEVYSQLKSQTIAGKKVK